MSSFHAWKSTRKGSSLFVKLSSLSRSWHPTEFAALPSVSQSYSNDRCFSCLSANRQPLQLKKSYNGPLQLFESRRNVQYNLFYLLVEVLEGQFMYIKNATDLDWWLIIVLSTMPYRIALACFLRKKSVEHKYKAKYINDELLPKYQRQEMKNISSPENMYLSEQEKMRVFSRKMKQHQKLLYKEHNYNPWSLILYSIIPLPFWIANSMALRSLCGANIVFLPDATSGIVSPDMHTGGMLWFTDLTVPDPYHILPIITSLSFLMMFELQALQNVNYGQKYNPQGIHKTMYRATKGVEYFGRAWCIFVTALFWNCPAAMTWYWCCSGIVALLIRILLTHPYVDRKLTPPNMHHLHDSHPYQTIWTNMKRRYNPTYWFLK